MPDYGLVLRRFACLKPGARANLWHARCPCVANHKAGDRNPSGRLWVDEDSQSLRWWCAKGCKWKDVVAAMGTDPRDWFPPADPRDRGKRKRGGGPMPGKVVATFDYVDERGDLLYQVCRTDPKGFFQRRPIPGHPGDWAYTLGGGKYGRDPQSGYWYERANNWPPNELVDLEEVRRVPYRLPDLVDAGKAKQPVLVAEGEGKVDLLRALGFVATCAAGGAGKWPVGFGGHLVGRRVVVLPDMDDVGMVHAHMVMASCVMFGAESVRIVRYGMGWEQMPEKSDVKDWLALQPGEGKRAALIDLIKQQPEWRPAA